MLKFLFTKKENEVKKTVNINEVYSKLKSEYNFNNVTNERKTFLSDKISQYGYLNYSYYKALQELTTEEILFGLEIKWTNNGIFKDGEFIFENDKISPLSRNNVNNSDWIKKEGHDIKLINLAGLGDGNKSEETGKFIDWLRQLLILPTGNLKNKIFNTTIYLIPFHPREFGCAYLPKSFEVSEKLFDENIYNITGMNVTEQVQNFITLAQLAGHPVIYDVLPQTGRFSKAVLATPEIARWYDITTLDAKISNAIDNTAEILSKTNDLEDVEVIKNIYKENSEAGNLTSHYQELFKEFDDLVAKFKKEYSEDMLKQSSQTKLHKRVKQLVATILATNPNKKLCEKDISKQIELIQELISQGLWPAPGGAWCSAGVPIYEKMSECGGYPTFKHLDYKGEDVTHFANLDCQTPYYFCNLENGKFNQNVIEFFVQQMKSLQKKFNFDGFRVDHIDHIVDEVSETNGTPISYRAPRIVLEKLNLAMKQDTPHFATLAEYMLWDDFLKEYHNDMKFDLLWGNDIISQFEKTPERIIEDNQHLTNYNVNFKQNMLSILKTYNNQDGEFSCIDQYPAQLGMQGALFKWFKYKFLPGGKFAQRSMMYVDGDESFTKRGIEHVIGCEISMVREDYEEFYEKFDAIDRFVKSEPIITDGEAQLITQDDDGFCAWIISKEPAKKAYLVVCNSNPPTEKLSKTDEYGNSYKEIVEGKTIKNKTLNLPVDYEIVTMLSFVNSNFEAINVDFKGNSLKLESITPSEFNAYELILCN
ncbi:MAG: hypothetical protein R3Y28_03560 [Candidatus Gastranaerophilales bacterium]